MSEINLSGFKEDLEDVRLWFLANKERVDNLEKIFHTFEDKKTVKMTAPQKKKGIKDAVTSVMKLRDVIIKSMEVHLGLKE